MDPITIFLSMDPMYKIITIAIWGVVGFTIHLILKTLKKTKPETMSVKEPIEHQEVKADLEPTKTRIEEPSRPLDMPIPFHPDELPKKRKFETIKEFKPMKQLDQNTRSEPEIGKLRPYQREGVHGYTRKPLEGPERELEIQRKAEELTKEEAWSELSESFWDTRREALKQFHPEIYEEIRYWETHLDDYETRIGLMWVFDIPLGKYDFWVRRH